MKLGPLAHKGTGQAVEWIRRAPIVKVMDQPALLDHAQPGAITVYRKYFANQDIYRNGADVAREVIADLKGRKPTYLELFNETAQTFAEGFARYVEFHREAAPVIHAYGCKLAGYCFSTQEHPAIDEWDYLVDHSFGDVDAIALHEYFGLQGFTDKNALYHRVLHAHHSKHPPFIITETGIDQVEGGPSGWKHTGMTAYQYQEKLLDYNGHLEHDRGYVIGATPFAAGVADDPKWWAFNTDELAIPGGPPMQIPSWEESMPKLAFIQGFADHAKLHPEDGQPIEQLQYDDQGNAWQHSTTGLMFWHKAANKVYFFPKE